MKKSFTLFQMKTKHLVKAVFLLLVVSFSTSWAQTAIFNPSMSISPYGSVNSPGSEQYGNIIDGNVNTKFLDFDSSDGMGFTVNLGGASYTASSISITTANDADIRDPRNYEVLASNDGSNFTSIATGVIQCISTRFFTRNYAFANTTAYKYYRVNFTNTCGDSMFQLSEVQLYTCGSAVGGSVSTNQTISGVISTTPSGEANLNSGSSAQIIPEINDYQCQGGYFQNCYWDGEQDVCYDYYDPCMYQYNNFIPGHNAAQSFKTSSNVSLNAIKIDVAEVINVGSYYLRIFQGEGDSGLELMNQGVSISNSGTNTFVLNTTLALTGGQSYTFKIETNDGNARFNWTNSSDSDYSRGSGYTDGNNNYSDFNFQLVYQNNVNWQSVTLSGFTGGIQKWQKATDSNFSSPTDIASTSATLDSHLVGDILQTTYFRAVVIGCSTVYSDYVTIAVNTPATKIQASQAGGRLPDLNTVIVADWFSSSVSQYRFKVVNGATTRTIETPNRGFSLSSLSGGGTYNTTYTISVAVRVNNNWGRYGDESLVSTPVTAPATKVVVTQCGTTLPDLYTVIVANWISGVTNYKFEVVNGATTRYIETTNRGFSLSSLVGGGTYNTTYTIRVATKAVGLGPDYGSYGIPCTVTTPTVPPATKIIDTQCGKVLPTLNTVIVATWISGVSGYRFEVVNGTTTRIIDTPNRGFSLSSLVGRGAYSTTYTIRVATKYFDVSTNQMVWGEYGTSCDVTTPSDPNAARAIVEKAIVTNEVSVKVYPNPFTSNFKLDFSSSSESNVEIVVYDMIGRQLERLQVGSSEMNNLELGNNYPSGVYNVIVKQGEDVKTLRVIKR